MPFLKSEHPRSVVATVQGSVILGLVNYRGVEMPRNGLNDPLIPFSVNYDTQIPNANVTYDVPSATLGVVWFFPVNAEPVTNTGHHGGRHPWVEYRKPRWSGRKPNP